MPFPLAHPAAVLPLKRYCPKYLSFAALVAGTLSPDVSYIFGPSGISDVAHTFVGGIAFGVIVGLIMLAAFYALVPLVLARCPERLGRALLPIRWQSEPGLMMVLLSLCIGVCTHLLLDSFTHTQGWVVQHLEILQMPLFSMGGRKVKVCHCLWYACSFLGVAALVWAFRVSQQPAPPQGQKQTRTSHVMEALLVATLVLPIEVLHHIVRSTFGLALVGLLSLGLMLLVLIKLAVPARS